GRLPVTSEDERRRVLALAGEPGGRKDAAPADVGAAIAAQAAIDGRAPAVTWAGETMTRGALRSRVRALAGRLAAAGGRGGGVVAVLGPRGFAPVTAPLAVMEAGGPYLPLDAQAPVARLAELVADSGAVLLLTHGAFASRRPAGEFTVLQVDDLAR